MKCQKNSTKVKIISAAMVLFLIAMCAIQAFSGFLTPQNAQAAVGNAQVAAISLSNSSPTSVTLTFTPADAKKGNINAELFDLAGKSLAQVKKDHDGKSFDLTFKTKFNPSDLANYYVRYRFSGGKFAQKSLFYLAEQLEVTVLGQRDLVAGSKPVLRVLVKDKAAAITLAGAKVTISLMEKDDEIFTVSGKTDKQGQLRASLVLPDRPISRVKLIVEVKSKATETITEWLNIKSATKTMLTTDKPIYQPGQTIHIRSLSLNKSNMKPLAKKELTFEITDAKGNKVFKKKVTTDDFGVSSSDFVLASELNTGTYKIAAIIAGAKEEKSVNVGRYVLPKYKVSFKTDRRFYEPGETVKVDLQSDYFFGKPVSGAKVKIVCSKFDVEYTEFKTVDAVTDKKGHYSFEVKLPERFVGQPLQAGKASVKFEVSIIDTADHKEEIVRNVVVTDSPILVVAIPEGGKMIPGLDNRVYIITTYADSSPVSCSVECNFGQDGKSTKIKTDEAGFGEISLKALEGTPIKLSLIARDAKGSSGKLETMLEQTQKAGDAYILVRTNKTLLKVGDEMKVTIASTRQEGPVYVDLIKDGQTYLTRTVELENGKASTEILLPAGLAGTVQVNAYLLSANGIMVRDRRLVMVDPANDLNIAVSSDAKTYLPAADAKLDFKVTDANGKGVAAALCVMVVDEAVYALQEMQPGLEKVYFYLEKEIAKPRYEIHGWEIESMFLPGGPIGGPGMPLLRDDAVKKGIDRREKAAKALLASAKGTGNYALHATSAGNAEKELAFFQKMNQQMNKSQNIIRQAFSKCSQELRKNKSQLKKGVTLADLVKKGYLKDDNLVDPWGGQMKVSLGNWCVSCQNYHGINVESAGIDGKWGSADDITREKMQKLYAIRRKAGGGIFGRGRGGMDDMAEGMPMPMVKRALMKAPNAENSIASDEKMGNTSSDASSGGPVRIRQYFPETLLFKPAIITDSNGFASMDFTLADSITTWRMSTQASSANGQLGSSTAPIRVFQDFFVDVDFPVSLTQNDVVWVPVAVYNYLKADQKVRLEVKPADWYELQGDAVIEVTLAPNEVKAVHFPILVNAIGYHTFTVIARGEQKADAVARSVTVVPDGKEFRVAASGRLTKDVAHTITIPADAIEGASKIFVKVYPGVLSQVIEGLDKILRMPSGCFEQTSSSTYPNILVMDYMKTTGKITPEVQMKAEGFINAGYQKLLSFEVTGGGFEWFGKAPAHKILTAFGLMEFYDMSKVHAVDPAVIARTQEWLVKGQEANGSYKPSKGGIAEGAINKFTDDIFRNTAYITWALASTGYDGKAIGRAVAYLEEHLDDIKDNYTLALVANAFATVNPKSKNTIAIIARLVAAGVADGDAMYWSCKSDTPTNGRGDTAAIETTALAVQALIRARRNFAEASQGVTYLSTKKDTFGTWSSTQATIQAMRAMLMAESDASRITKADIAININSKDVQVIKITADNSDVLQLVDLADQTATGDNEIAIGFKGQGGLMYQIVGRYYLPHAEEDIREEPISINVKYDRTQLNTNDVVTVRATITNNRLHSTAKMVLVDLGLPPGFILLPQLLEELVEKGTIEKFSVTGRQVTVYLRELKDTNPIELQYELLAKYPLIAKTPKSVVYEYYNPKIRAEAKPIELTVKK